MVISKRIAPRMRSPVNAELVMIRVRIWWMRSNISASPEEVDSSRPYSRNALGVLPPLWSRAAMNPGAVAIFWSCSVFIVPLRPPRGGRPYDDVADLAGAGLRDGACLQCGPAGPAPGAVGAEH